ncbi:Ger(x)C family spore germination protein [Thalassobacillus sp. CUG 92003]|uniref:Ger(x)C family spore germination protein n=1 Tax=Thalassobacillus sp. CUG 92003 TaxID=2736641 RepID=UPI0015E65111|nr:Ger(x)C family spore germination protein [Thalassobacillus sp. CUG 92003]
MKKIVISLIMLTLLTGCVQKNYIERLGIITGAGYDENEDGSIRGTYVMLQFDPTSSQVSQVLTSKAETTKEIIKRSDLKTSHKLVSGQIRLSLYGAELAEQGIMWLLDTMTRDAKVADMMYLGISETTSNDILTVNNYEDAPNAGIYIHRMLEKNIKTESLPKSTLHQFLHEYYDKGLDPTLPLLAKREDKAEVTGLALFKNDKYVGNLNSTEGFFFKLVKDSYKAGQIELTLPKERFEEDIPEEYNQPDDEELHLTLENIVSKSKIDVTGDAASPKFTVNIKMDARLIEVSEDLKIKQRRVIKKLETEMEDNMTRQLNSLIDKLKELEIDPLGFGKIYNSTTVEKPLSTDEWRTYLTEMDVDFKVKISLIRHGVIE